MSHPLIAPERTDQALFMSQILIEPSIAPQLDAEFGADVRAHVLEKVLPLAGQVIVRATPDTTQVLHDIGRRYVRHETVVDDTPDLEDTMHGDAQILLYEPPLPAERSPEKAPSVLSPDESDVILAAAKLVALKPTRKGDDLVALDFLANNSPELKGKVSKFILDTAGSRRRTRAFLTNVLLRVA